ncbi:MAG TPA: DUF134 domain-containing protein [Caldithrix abyssi]|uniref:UPF0251 protein ENJ89_01815 n=1 Tax=Caldithrix abyssi TaxID=187145 RepID=A0A7V5PN16_CALAY|nr:DUF134 domain-containing protein [Caldithrix abyssi]
MRGPYRKRWVANPPRYTLFKPSGIPGQELPVIILTIDEFEAIRLADLMGLDHQRAADQMGISRPTFSRLIEKARHKYAKALVEGFALRIEGGHVDFQQPFFECDHCGAVFPPSGSERCPECASANVHPWAGGKHRGHGHGWGRGKGGRR